MKNQYLSVSALTKYIKRKLDTDPHLNDILLKGEISNFNHHTRGHMYLTIKDDHTRVRAVMFAGNNRNLKFTPENGMNVLIKGEISLFEPFGQYQLYIQQMEPDGIGALFLAFEQLKNRLNEQGYFDKDRKKNIPIYPNHIGIITSSTGAAVRDIISTINRRYPIVNKTLIPTLVQGKMAAQSIKNAIEQANQQQIFDVLIVGRGGGSIEELWSFNEEIVAKAIYNSEIPIISAVGHETDMTISDYVADLRAPTPTSAAELAVPSEIELIKRTASLKRHLTSMMVNKISNHEQHLKRIMQSYAFKYPENLVKQNEQELDKVTDRLEKGLAQLVKSKREKLMNINSLFLVQHPKKQLDQAFKDLNQLVKRSQINMSQIYKHQTRALSTMIEKLTILNPLEVMKRGFAIPYQSDGQIIKSQRQVQEEERIMLRLNDGTIDCQVKRVKENKND